MRDMESKPNTKTAITLTEASKMLEAALQQMDGIISGATASSSLTNVSPQTASSAEAETSAEDSLQEHGDTMTSKISDRQLSSASNVLSIAKTLALALQEGGGTAPIPDSHTAVIIGRWLENHYFKKYINLNNHSGQNDKESLEIQYQELVNRTSQQADRIIELESLLTEKTQQLSVKDELLQRQVLSRSTLETQKLEFMTVLSELKLHRATLERENIELAKGITNENHIIDSCNASPQVDRNFASFDKQHKGSLGNLSFSQAAMFGQSKTSPGALRHKVYPHFHSLPRSVKNNVNNNNQQFNNANDCSFDANANMSMTKQRNVVFASNEKIVFDDNGDPNCDVKAGNYGNCVFPENTSSSSNLRERSTKGSRTMFGIFRRSNSGNLELPALERKGMEFKRGGVGRATAGGRIEWNVQSLHYSSKHYADWLPNEVCNWLSDLGLGCYSEDCRKWLNDYSNVCFFTAAPADIEKELNLKTPLHRKKLFLAIDEITGKENDPLALKAAQLDTTWTLRWLDDIGLPQYKDSFVQAKMDGRMLHRLTMEDLANMHISSCLHVASLRCGIQIMRKMNWDPECLVRRSISRDGVSRDIAADDDETAKAASGFSDESIALWTAHRVMEWLRVADLSEYAPNLRGAGVHGALMLFEIRFNANLLGDLLSIPSSKTLLRRHLATHFKELLGRNILQIKRDAEAAPGYQPLTISAKLKPLKKTQFSLKRRKSTKGPSDFDWTNYVCPMSTIPTACPSVSASVLHEQSRAFNAVESVSTSLSETSANKSNTDN